MVAHVDESRMDSQVSPPLPPPPPPPRASCPLRLLDPGCILQTPWGNTAIFVRCSFYSSHPSTPLHRMAGRSHPCLSLCCFACN